MKKDKYLTFGWSGFRMLAMMLMGILVMMSCKDDDADGAAYVRISDDFKVLSYDPQGGQQGYEMYTNLKNWTLQTVYQTQSEGWVDVFDNQGSGDGRFVVTVNPNTTHPFERRAEVHVVSGGVIYETIKIRQAGVSPYLEVDLGGLTAVSVTNKSTTALVNLNTNVLWDVEIPAEAKEWLSLGESTPTSQTFAFTANPNAGNREALVRFYMVGTGNENVNATVQIIQRGMDSDPEKAQLMTIKNFVETVSGIAPNVKVEGVVVSDPASENFPANACFIQDESGRGMYLEFTSAASNKYAMNTKLTVHLVGLGMITDSQTGSHKISGITPDCILADVENSTAPTPVAVNSLSTIGDNLENTLVTLKNVEFAIPVGTYVNIYESQYASVGNATSIYLGDTPSECGHLLRDASGNTLKLYSSYKFRDKFSTLMPQGSGDVTGIVVKRTVNKVVSNSIRLRKASDNAVSNNEADRVTKTLVQFGPYTTIDELVVINATKGTGKIKTTTFEKIVSGSSSNYMYWSWTYARRNTATFNTTDYKGIPEMQSDVAMQYSCLNCNSWWKSSQNNITPKGDGSAWVTTFSTVGVTGDLKLAFNTASSQTGPRYFTIEWAESEDATTWATIGTYESVDWNSNYQLLQYSFDLPAEMKGKQNVVLRMRVNHSDEARNKPSSSSTTGITTIASGGTNRIGVLSVVELK